MYKNKASKMILQFAVPKASPPEKIAYISQMQKKLNVVGVRDDYNNQLQLQEDGIFGFNTMVAIQKFKNDLRLIGAVSDTTGGNDEGDTTWAYL